MSLELVGQFSGAGRIRWSPDGRYLSATAAIEGSTYIPIWDNLAGADLGLHDHVGAAGQCLWSPDSTRLSTTVETLTRIWDVPSRTTVATLNHPAGWSPAQWSPDGSLLLIAGSGGAGLWDTADGALRLTLSDRYVWGTGARWSPDGGRLVIAARNDLAQVWDAAAGELLLELRCREVSELAWSPDARFLITRAGPSNGWDVRVWSCGDGSLVRRFGRPFRRVNAASWAPAGHLLAVTGRRSTDLWDAATDAVARTLPGGGQDVTWSADGTRLATSATQVRLWSPSTGALLRTFDGRAHRPLWSPDEGQVATVWCDATTIWDAETGELRHTIRGFGNASSPQVRWSADSRHIVAHAADLSRDPDQTIAIRSQAYPEFDTWVHVFSSPYSIAMSPDGRHVAAHYLTTVKVFRFA